MKSLLVYIRFFADNVAGTAVFYCAYRLMGPKPAIALSVSTCLAQLVYHHFKKLQFSPIFFIANGTIVTLGCVDLLLETPRFVRFEPGLASLLPGLVLLYCVLTRKPLLAAIMESNPGVLRLSPGEVDSDYLERFGLLIVVLVLAKAGLCFYLAFHVDLGNLWVLRKILGGVIGFLIFGGEAFLRRWLKMETGGSPSTPPASS